MTLADMKKRLRQNHAVTLGVYLLKYNLWMPLRTSLAYRRILRDIANSNGKGSRERLPLPEGRKSCFIVGNGPSVRFEDLDAIAESGLDSFGANRITDVFSKTTWRPTYMGVMDPGFLIGPDPLIEPDAYFRSLNDPRVKGLFLADKLHGIVPDGYPDGKVHFFQVPYASLFSTNLLPFSEDPLHYVSDLGSVTCFNIQIACAMGYEHIFLYGIDHHYTRYLGVDGRIHVDNERDSYVQGIKHAESEMRLERAPRTKYGAYHMKGFSDVRKMDIGYRTCKEYTDNHGVSVINLTHGGELEVFPRGDFDKVIREEEDDER